MFNFIDELFVPGRKHTEDERNRLELSREDEGSSDPARGPIDLESGAVIVRPAHQGPGEATGSEAAEGVREADAPQD
jgi:hypothetical protein